MHSFSNIMTELYFPKEEPHCIEEVHRPIFPDHIDCSYTSNLPTVHCLDTLRSLPKVRLQLYHFLFIALLGNPCR